MSLPSNVLAGIAQAAPRRNFAPADIAAIVEIESAGRAFERDGITPFLLFERHVFHRELRECAPLKLALAAARGLAIPKWDRATQYQDQGTSAGRLALLARARAIDDECANRSASWGLGQTMGFHAEKLGYASATDMVERLSGGIDAQLDALFREIESDPMMAAALRTGNVEAFARAYNGPGYRQNNYHLRLDAARKRWQRRFAAPAQAAGGASETRVKTVQQRLRDLGYVEVGEADGRIGGRTVAALAAFRHDAGLPQPEDGETIDDALIKALQDWPGRPPAAVERQAASVETLRAAGSQTVADGDLVAGLGKMVVGTATGVAAADQTGALDHVQGALEQAQQASEVLAALHDAAAWAGRHWWLWAILGGIVLWRIGRRISWRRVVEHRLGIHLGR